MVLTKIFHFLHTKISLIFEPCNKKTIIEHFLFKGWAHPACPFQKLLTFIIMSVTKEKIEHLRYPIGRFSYEPGFSAAKRTELIENIRRLPAQLKERLEKIDGAILEIPYRPEGWNISQVVHHIADSHMNAFIRFKLGLTEDIPTIKPYKEGLWANLADTQHTPITVSLALIEALHTRWLVLLESMDEADWQRAVFHPEYKKELKLEMFLGLYSWHCSHHLGHIDLVLNKV